MGSGVYKFNRSVVWLNANAEVNESNLVEYEAGSQSGLVECKGK